MGSLPQIVAVREVCRNYHHQTPLQMRNLNHFLSFPILDRDDCVVVKAVADLGFPQGGGANSPGGRQHTILPIFPENCMKLKEFGPPGGGAARPKFYYVDPPLERCGGWGTIELELFECDGVKKF